MRCVRDIQGSDDDDEVNEGGREVRNVTIVGKKDCVWPLKGKQVETEDELLKC